MKAHKTKKPYECPRLEIYGDIRRLTTRGSGTLDGGTSTTKMV